MNRFRLLLVAAVASSALLASPAPAQARCLPEYAAVCRAVVVVCEATGNHCAA